jgi:hypothetical protein
MFDNACIGVGLTFTGFTLGFRFCYAAPHLKGSRSARLVTVASVNSAVMLNGLPPRHFRSNLIPLSIYQCHFRSMIAYGYSSD